MYNQCKLFNNFMAFWGITQTVIIPFFKEQNLKNVKKFIFFLIDNFQSQIIITMNGDYSIQRCTWYELSSNIDQIIPQPMGS